MRNVLRLMAIAAIAVQPAMLSAAPATAPGAKASATGNVLQARQETVRLAMLQGQGQGQAGQGQGGGNEGTPPGRVRRTTVLSRVILFAPAAAIGGLLIALAAGGGNDEPISQ